MTQNTHIILAEILVLVGTAGAGGTTPLASAKISARLKRVQGHLSPVNNTRRLPHGAAHPHPLIPPRPAPSRPSPSTSTRLPHGAAWHTAPRPRRDPHPVIVIILASPTVPPAPPASPRNIIVLC